jgi:DNA polymerase-3 subunit gamma/tau
VLARAGEGSVRDSLSAMDQAIACCGTTLDAGEIRELLGVFSLESLEQVATALAASDSRKMMEIVAELEANGRGLQHFSRELARYFRNLLVVKIAGGPTRLVAASANEQQRLLETAAKFSEEDLTRYLQLALDLFRDLQSSLQPRLHLEIGLLRMVHAGRLRPIEEALASLSPSGGAPARSAPAPAAPPPAAPPPAASPAPALSGDLRSRLHAALLEARQMHIADAVEHSEISESGQELIVTTPKMYVLYLKQPDFEAAARRVLGRPVRITVRAGEAAAAPLSSAPAGEDALRERALSHPEVRRFQEEFPGSQVRAVRNLRENEA